MSESVVMRGSRRLCSQVCRQSKSSFLASFALLDRPRRQAMCALYAFARITDDFGDSSASLITRTRQLDEWRKQLWQHVDRADGNAACDKGGQSTGQGVAPSIWPALSDCIQRYHIPLQLLDDIISGVAMDLTPNQPADWIELKHYCYHVASSVGLACAHIWRAESGSNGHERNVQQPVFDALIKQSAIDCGIAFQLTNILRDISEDASLGRIYIPQCSFAKYEVNVERWLVGQPSGDWETMLDEVGDQARQLYTAGWPTIEALTPRSQRMFSLMWRSYHSLLERVVTDKRQLWGKRRVRLPKTQRIGLLTTHFVSPIYARLSPP